ncbi:hypothetical protein Vadar_033450 [Vaccinium darrowii]|uniref:Uncharacterized protein n=1 Tax=Vaccinium darrowii TaxID=229202 RepID=A0ACB7X621_9ERIC|nr:hypothetical protein Vadar_033450 [Vaccinium darrowii]
MGSLDYLEDLAPSIQEIQVGSNPRSPIPPIVYGDHLPKREDTLSPARKLQLVFQQVNRVNIEDRLSNLVENIEADMKKAKGSVGGDAILEKFRWNAVNQGSHPDPQPSKETLTSGNEILSNPNLKFNSCGVPFLAGDLTMELCLAPCHSILKGHAWTRRSWRVGEEYARTVTSAIGRFASTELPLQRAVLPPILQLLIDSNHGVREAAMSCIEVVLNTFKGQPSSDEEGNVNKISRMM